MQKQNMLHNLVQSLTGSEKRYFQLSSQIQPGPKNYLLLFEVLKKMRVYDSAVVREKLKGAGLNLSYEMQYLEKMIFRALRNFHEGKDENIHLYQGLMELKILFEKKLYKECSQRADSYCHDAIATGQYSTALLLLGWKLRCSLRNPDKGLEKYSAESARLVAWIDELEQLRRIQASLLRIHTQRGHAGAASEHVKEVRRILKHPLLKNPGAVSTHIGKLVAHDNIKMCHNSLGNVRASYHNNMKALRLVLMEKNKAHYTVQMHFALLHGLINNALMIVDTPRALRHVAQMEQLLHSSHPTLTPSLLSEIETKALINKVTAYGYGGHFPETLDTMGVIRSKQLPLQPRDTIIFSYLEALSHFYLHRYDAALTALQPNLQAEKEKTRMDFILHSKALLVMIHYELRNFKLLPSLILSLERFAKKNRYFDTHLARLLRLFRSLAIAGNNKAASLQCFAEYRKFLKRSRQGEVADMVNIQLWLKNKIRLG